MKIDDLESRKGNMQYHKPFNYYCLILFYLHVFAFLNVATDTVGTFFTTFAKFIAWYIVVIKHFVNASQAVYNVWFINNIWQNTISMVQSIGTRKLVFSSQIFSALQWIIYLMKQKNDTLGPASGCELSNLLRQLNDSLGIQLGLG